jgi:hypothetical protein
VAAGAAGLLAAIVGAGCSSSPGDSTACGQSVADYCEFYGPNSDQLGAVTKSGPPDGEAVCVAGPGSFVVPSCGQAAVETCPGVDAGAD